MADQSSMTYTQSLQEAKGHGQAFLKSTIGAHPVTAAVVMALLLVLVLVLAFYVVRYKAKCDKAGGSFHIAPISNLTTGNNNPEWQLGSMDAGNYGPVHREATAWNVAAYHPSWRAGRYRQVSASGKEGLAANNSASAAACAPGESAVTYQNPDGSVVTYCRSTDALPGPAAVCHRGWDPAASAEAEALATVGSLQHDSYGEAKLQRAISAAYDASTGLSDAQLMDLQNHSDLA